MNNGQSTPSQPNDPLNSGLTAGVGEAPADSNPLHDNLDLTSFMPDHDSSELGHRALNTPTTTPLSEPDSTTSPKLGEVVDLGVSLATPPTQPEQQERQESVPTDAQVESDQIIDKIAEDGKVSPAEAKEVEKTFLPEFNTDPADAYDNIKNLRKKIAQAAMKGAA